MTVKAEAESHTRITREKFAAKYGKYLKFPKGLLGETVDWSVVYEKTIAAMDGISAHANQLVLIVERHAYETGCHPGRRGRPDPMSMKVDEVFYLGVLDGRPAMVQESVIRGGIVVFTKAWASRDYSGGPTHVVSDGGELIAGSSLIGSVRSLGKSIDDGLRHGYERFELEVVPGDDAVEEWLSKRPVYAEVIRALRAKIDRPDKHMRDAADAKREKQRKEVMERLGSYPAQILADIKLAQSIGVSGVDKELVGKWITALHPLFADYDC